MNKTLFYGLELLEAIEVWRCWRALVHRPARRIVLTQAQVDSLIEVNGITTRRGGYENGEYVWELYIGDMRVAVQTVDYFASAGVVL